MELAAYLAALAAHPVATSENLVVMARVGSTHALARRMVLSCLAESSRVFPCLVTAWEQTAGRGRRGNTWASPPGMGIYATWIEPLPPAGAAAPGRPGEALTTLPLLAGIGLARALGRHLPGAACRLKWPNDLVVEGRKLGGILLELVTDPDPDEEGVGPAAALLSFGINVLQTAAELPLPTATSVALAAAALSGADPVVDLPDLIGSLVTALREELTHLGDTAYAAAAYRSLSAHQPGDVLHCRAGESVATGTFLGFDDRGFLRLRERGGQERLLSAGEILEP